MNDKHIDLPRALALLNRAVEDRGEDFVYPPEWREFRPAPARRVATCLYFLPEGTPACIIGKVGSYLGVTAEDVKRTGKFVGAARFFRDLGFTVTPAAERVLIRAQTAQDEGTPWGEVLKQVTEPERLRYGGM